MSTIEKEEESADKLLKKTEDLIAKEKIMERSAILAKARKAKLEKQEAKKRKLDESENFLEVYNQQVENIHGHIKLINTNINTIVDILNSGKKKAKYDDEEEKATPPQALVEEKEVVKPLLSSNFSYMIGQALAVALAGGSLYYFKTQKEKINPAHVRYSAL